MTVPRINRGSQAGPRGSRRPPDELRPAMPSSEKAIGGRNDDKPWDPELVMLYRTVAEPLVQYLRRTYRLDMSVAADIVHDAFLLLYRVWPKDRPKAYVFAIATHLVYRMWRRQERERDCYLAAFTEDSGSRDDPDARLVIQSAIDALPRRQREAIVLRETYGFPYDDVAKIMGTSVGTAKALVHQGRKNLHRSLGNLVEEDES
jgi:RNA polymerase sigma factor (sigma-70 family)